MKLTFGKFYKVTYSNRGNEYTFIGRYEGIETGDYVEYAECNVCESYKHKKLHQFNLPYEESEDNIPFMLRQIFNFQYETRYFGTSCINKCKIELVEGDPKYYINDPAYYKKA